MASFSGIQIKMERRECKVNGKPGYFHCWEHYSSPIPPSALRGGHSGGLVSFVRGLVEFPEGMGYADPKDIRFCDEIHAELCAWDEFEKEKNV